MPPKGEKRKQQIIDAAKDMFINRGFQSTHIGQVCEELDIARGTVYQYFSNKKEILYAILESVSENIEDILDPDDLKEFLRKKPEYDTIVKFVDNRIAGVLSVFSTEPIVIRLIYRDIVGVDDEVTTHVDRFMGRITTVLSKEIEVLRNNNIFRSGVDPDIAASMLVGGIMAIVFRYSKKHKDFLDKAVTTAMSINYLHGVYEENP